MDQNKLDQIFKEGLEHHRSDLDKQALWQAIRDDVPSEKPPNLRLLSIGILLGMGIMSLFWVMNNESKSAAMINSQPAVEKNLETKTEALITGKEQKTDMKSIPATTKKISEPTQQKDTASRKKSKASPTSERPYSAAATLNPATAQKYNTSNTIRNEYNKKNLNTKSAIRKTLANQPPTQRTTTQLLNDSSPDAYTSPSSTSSLLAIPNTKVPTPDFLQDIQSLKFKAPENINVADRILNLKKIKLAPNKEVECYDYNKKKGTLSAEVYGLVDYINSQMQTSAQQTAYLDERKKTQSQREGYRSGVRLKYAFGNGLYVKTGLEAGLIREIFRVSKFETRTEILPNQLLEIIEKGDSTIYIYGNQEVTIESEKRWRVKNNYKSLGVPLLLGYQLQLGKLYVGLEGGAIYNLKYDFKGYLLDNLNAPIDDPDFFKPSINTSVTGSLVLGFPLSRKVNFLTYCSAKHNLDSINNEAHEIQQKNTRLGIGLGLELLLGG